MVGDLDGFPIEEVGRFFALDFPHETAAGMGTRILRRFVRGLLDTGGLPKAVPIGHDQAQAAFGIDVMEFQVLGFQPRMAPFEVFAAAEFAQDIFLGHPVEEAYERGEIP